MFEDVLRFWLDRGVDGFRVDVAHGLFKEASLRDQVVAEGGRASSGQVNTDHSMVSRELKDEPMWDQPEVHDVYRAWHRVLDEAARTGWPWPRPGPRRPSRWRAFVRPDELDQAFNFAWLLADWSAESFASVITDTLAAVAPVGASPTWVLSNHDVVRHVTRYGGGAQGLARGRAATLAMLALPGSATSTRARSSASSRSTSPRSTGRTRRTSAPARSAATAAASRSRGAAAGAVRLRARATTSRGSRSRPTGPR